MSRVATGRLLRRPVAAAANGQLAAIPFLATSASNTCHGASVPPAEDVLETRSRVAVPIRSLGIVSPDAPGMPGAPWALRAFSVSAPATVADSSPKATTSTSSSTSSSDGTSTSVGEAGEQVRDLPSVSELDALFRCRPTPLGTGPNPAVAVSRAPGLGGMILGALGYYGKESRLIMGARSLYAQISRRADDEAFLGAFGLEKSFRASHAMLVLHTWLCLVRLRAEEQKEDAAEIGQTIYDLLNHDCEKRVVAAGVTVLITRWMKELEKNFYGACLAYDGALKPEAAKGALETAVWSHRNILYDGDGEVEMSSPESAAAARALARYVRLELSSLAMTESDAFMTGNVKFSSASAVE